MANELCAKAPTASGNEAQAAEQVSAPVTASGATVMATRNIAEGGRPALPRKRRQLKSVPLNEREPEDLSIHDFRERMEIVRRAFDGDTSVRNKVHEILEECGPVQDMAERVQEKQLRGFYGRSVMITEEINRSLEKMRQEIAGENPPPLEKILVDRILLTWVQLAHFEENYAEVANRLSGMKAHVMHQDRIERAQRRYLAAVKALAQVRRLQIPTLVQVNVLDRQASVSDDRNDGVKTKNETIV